MRTARLVLRGPYSLYMIYSPKISAESRKNVLSLRRSDLSDPLSNNRIVHEVVITQIKDVR